MKVILQQDVRGQGKKGQMIDAAEGDTRSVLTPDLIRQLYGVESVLLDTPDGAALLPVRGGDRHV